MIRTATLIGVALAQMAPAAAPPTPVEGAVGASVRACERWLLEPATWAGDIAGFPRRSGVTALQPQPGVPSLALPPPPLRSAMHNWRLPIGQGGIYLTASDRMPVCHLAGGGPFDMQPGIEAALARPPFRGRWRQLSVERADGLLSSHYVSTAEPRLTLIVTRAQAKGARLDRIQYAATFQYKPGK